MASTTSTADPLLDAPAATSPSRAAWRIHPDGSFALTAGGFVLDGCRARLRVDGEDEDVRWTPAGENEIVGDSPSGHWRLSFSISIDSALAAVVLRFGGRLARPVARLEIIPLEIPSLAVDHLLALGGRMGRSEAVPLPRATRREFESWHHCPLTRGDETLLLSMPLRMDYPGMFRGLCLDTGVEDNGNGTAKNNGNGRARGVVERVRAVFPIDPVGPRMSEGALNLPPVAVAAGDGFALMEQWAARQAAESGRTPAAPRDASDANAHAADAKADTDAGWNSWDYYRWTVTEDAVLENAEFIARDPVLSRHVKRIMIDDGWQYCYGEWEPNHHFPSGMEKLARRLTRMGFEPGLWFAPAVLEPHSQIAQLRPDMLALSRGGLPCLVFECMARRGFALDPTVEKSRRWLRDLFDRYAAMGYRHIKLDFLHAAALAPRLHDPDARPGERIGRLLEPIVEGLDGRARILGCNYPFYTGCGLVDAVRVGSDIHARWDRVRDNAVAIGGRHWADRTLWRNDPDFALCRGPDTSDDPELDRLRPLHVFIKPEDDFVSEHDASFASARRGELEVLLGLVLMSGGEVNLSDRLSRLNADGLALARRVVSAPKGRAARPLDLFRNERPVLWRQEVGGRRRLMAVNWSDRERSFAVSPGEHGMDGAGLTDFWREAPVAPPADGILRFTLAPRSCRVFEADATQATLA